MKIWWVPVEWRTTGRALVSADNARDAVENLKDFIDIYDEEDSTIEWTGEDVELESEDEED